jgi:adenosylmethionine-8-amino-7-oxononanoate aminotransferase
MTAPTVTTSAETASATAAAASDGSVGVGALLHPFARPAARADEFVNIVRGEGAHVFDADGRRYIDGLASLWYCAAGHGRAEIVDAVASQLRELAAFHLFEKFTNPVADAVAARIAGIAPVEDARVFLTNGGSEAVDSAVKISRLTHALAGQPDRTIVISRSPSYHGVTLGATTLTGLAPNRENFGPLVGDIVRVDKDDLTAVETVMVDNPGRVAAVIAEPVVGAGGLYPPVPGYLEGLRGLCDTHGAHLVLDEVITGFGRLGQWFAGQYFGVRPDLVTFAKAVTSGYQPLGGVIVGPSVHLVLAGAPDTVLRTGGTYAGHPAACAAALANLDILEHEGLVERAPEIGARLATGLRAVAATHGLPEVRGLGGMWAVGLPDGLAAPAVRDRMLEEGAIVRPIGLSTLAFCPPLMIALDDVDALVAALNTALTVS